MLSKELLVALNTLANTETFRREDNLHGIQGQTVTLNFPHSKAIITQNPK